MEEVRNLQYQPDWEHRLHRLLPPGNGRRRIVVAAPKYLDIALGKGGDIPPGVELVVKGDLRLEGPGAGGGIRALPRVIVSGSVVISQHRDIEAMDLVCCGGCIIHDCRGLREVKGRVFGNARIELCPALGRLGADLSCESDLRILGCGKVTSLNCAIGGDFEGVGLGGLTGTGPAFAVGGHAGFRDCGRLAVIRGRISGNMRLDRAWGSVDTGNAQIGGRISCPPKEWTATQASGYMNEPRRPARRGARGRGR